jgi:putative hydrolase
MEELTRVADQHVRDITGLDPSPSGSVAGVAAVSRAEWASRTLDHLRPLLERLAQSLGSAPVEAGPDELLGNLGQVMAPVVMGFTAGSMVGYLARRALAQYDLPLPRPAGDDLLIVPEGISEFASDWSLPGDDVRMWICVHELTHHAVLRIPHVRDRMQALLDEYVGGFRPDPSSLEGQLSGIDPGDPSSFQELLSNPETLLGAVQTAEQRQTQARLSALAAAITGYVDHVLDSLGGRLIGAYGPMTEALRRRRVESSDSDRFVSRLLGLEMDQRQYDRGERFAQGVAERAGSEGLSRLWTAAENLPTPAEIDAPGLWLARLDLSD